MRWANQCTDMSAFILLCSLQFFFLDFVSADLALTGFKLLTWTSYFHCFGALRVGPRARTPPHVLAWRMGVIIMIVEPLSQSDKRCLTLVFPWIVENTWKQGPMVRIFSPHPPDCCDSRFGVLLRAARFGAIRDSTNSAKFCPRCKRYI